MRDLAKEHQVTVWSDDELKAGLAMATRRLGHLKWKRRRLADGVNLNAILARYLRMSPAEQEVFTTEGLEALKEILEANEFTRPETVGAYQHAPAKDDDIRVKRLELFDNSGPERNQGIAAKKKSPTRSR